MEEVLWNVSSMKLTAGANMEDASGEIKVMLDSKPRSKNLRDSGKLRGISGSCCDSQPTIPLSRSESGSLAGSRRAFLLLDVRLVAIRESLLFVLTLELTRVIPWPSRDFRGPALIDAWV
jgi:hypothetical protein